MGMKEYRIMINYTLALLSMFLIYELLLKALIGVPCLSACQAKPSRLGFALPIA